LFSIQGYILTLLEGGLEDEKINRVFLERASTSVDRMVNLIEDLDEITKLESNSIKMDMQDFDLKKLTREIIDSLELKAQEKQIKLRFSIEYSSLMVNGDLAKVSQVLTNLINNSINYGNDKGETVIRFHEIDDLILVEISDNGPGIAKKDIPRLFERFYRVEKSRTRNEGGSGLGLAIVKHIVESHNQTINVRSTLGIGSTFSFTLEKANSKDSELVTSKGIKIR
jgi:two-component system phosphate regulon sensor histidine kinase PhoR